MQIEITMNCHFTPVRMAIINRIRDNKWWEDVEKIELPYTVLGM